MRESRDLAWVLGVVLNWDFQDFCTSESEKARLLLTHDEFEKRVCIRAEHILVRKVLLGSYFSSDVAVYPLLNILYSTFIQSC